MTASQVEISEETKISISCQKKPPLPINHWIAFRIKPGLAQQMPLTTPNTIRGHWRNWS